MHPEKPFPKYTENDSVSAPGDLLDRTFDYLVQPDDRIHGISSAAAHIPWIVLLRLSRLPVELVQSA